MIKDLLRGMAELDEALPGYEEARRYFDGNVDEFFASEKIRQLVRETGARYRFNLSKKPVTTLANRVEVAAVTVPNNAPATTALGAVWDANDMDVTGAEIILRTFEFGDAYGMAWPVEDDPEDPSDDPVAAAGALLVYNSPTCVRAIYDDENARRVKFVIKRWQVGPEGSQRWRADLYYHETVEPWISRVGASGKEEGDWEEYHDPDDDEAVWPLPNPLGEPPFAHFRTDMPYGRPVHRDAYGPQDSINKTLITMLTALEGAGWPERYGLSEKGAELDQANDDPDWADDTDADDKTRTTGGTSTSDRSAPGTFRTLHGMKGVGQFNPADPTVFIAPTEMLVRLMASTTDTPMHLLDRSGDQPSGESRRVAEAPLVANARTMCRRLKSPWSRFLRLGLKAADVDVPQVDVRFSPVESVTDEDGWKVLEMKRASGIPRTQIWSEAGYSPEQIAEWDQAATAADKAAQEAARAAVDAAAQQNQSDNQTAPVAA